ncbi:Arc family DNA-binding protein [uncultured Pseudacidovorax sp.]|uniref:Arc family DNA-binding protein n=1 Tax=uncultured Pseudacidovorax sp. TaxID=679313 RepID=UPI0025EDF02A|nr:Arc family DNA-binding protein [uncultured Pseudacidovorax sp.]
MSTPTPHTKPATRVDSIRLPAELRAFLLAQAQQNTRSFSGEIVHRLEQSRQTNQPPTLTKEQQQ